MKSFYTLRAAVLALTLLSAHAFAADVPATPASAAAAKADAAKGDALYNTGDAARNLPACVSCHGSVGNSSIVENPKLAGQHEAYLYKQLSQFKTKAGAKAPERMNAVMNLYAAQLSDAEMKNISAYLAAQVQKPGSARGSKESLAIGEKIYRGGVAEKNVPACAGCHGANGAGIPAQYGRIGGQHAQYTEAQLLAFRGGVRKNNAAMMTIASRLSDAEIKSVADYVAGLR